MLPPAVKAAMLEQIKSRRQFPTPGALASRIDPRTVQTPALDLVDAELVRIANQPGGRLIVCLPPQQGKSTRISQVFPVWMLMRKPDLPVIVASYGESLAERNGETIRNTITWNDLGVSVGQGSSSKRRWRLEGHKGGVLSAGIGSGMTGWASGLTIIDDPIKDQSEADSKTYRDRVWNWWLTVAQTRLAPGAPVIVVLTRWHTDDLAGRLLAAPDGDRWRVLNVPAQCEDPDADPLGREAGEYMQSARLIEDEHTGEERPMTAAENIAYWESIKVGVGARTWAALYQGRPSPAEGGLIKREWWRYWADLPALDGKLIQSWDLAFKGAATSDWVVGQVWMRQGADAYLLDQVRGRWGFNDTVEQIKRLTAKWPQAHTKLIEDKANGPAVIDSLKGSLPGVVPVNPQGGKEARAAAVEPFLAAGNVHIPSPTVHAWSSELVEEAAAFPSGAHDDQVDALTQALARLFITPAVKLGRF